MPLVKRAYHYRFYPTDEQVQQLAHTFGCARFVYNWGLATKSAAYETDKTQINYVTLSSKLTELKKAGEHHWLKAVSSVVLQQALRNLDNAFGNFFKGLAKYPNFKKKHHKQSATYAASAFQYKNGQLFLAKHKQPLNIRWSRPLPSAPTTVTVSKDAAGRYFVSCLCECETPLLPLSPKTVGIDLGIKSVLTTDTGWESGNPKYTQRYELKLAKAQRVLAKKQLGSQNRLKAKRKVARIHAKIADSRRDFTHKLTTQLINENQVISMEMLRVKNMVKNPKLAKAISDSHWGELARQLQYKADWYGRTIVKIDQWTPSSKTCSCCGFKLDSLLLSVRQWTCPQCHTVYHRDQNAAKNIKAEGLSVLAFGERVSGVGLAPTSCAR
ncbi:MAG: RNA-guided endonuclease TnpB family protein [Thiofilum sp.]|uniref:RNA-guided endonuclease TnpB family protein n=1 Tax=Thiofilum sp. TaxID=2212733 RepID=UPI0025E72B99|nr:RNA-guided endonuclease TnpB family protein [Thiofilum sp.]MBK8453539.1 transposase [Thiofilum sp.]